MNEGEATLYDRLERMIARNVEWTELNEGEMDEWFEENRPTDSAKAEIEAHGVGARGSRPMDEGMMRNIMDEHDISEELLGLDEDMEGIYFMDEL